MATTFLSISEVAQRLGVSRWTVARMLTDGEIPHVPVRGVPRVDSADLEAWIELQKAASIQRAAQRSEEKAETAGLKRQPGRPRKDAITQKKRKDRNDEPTVRP